MENNCKLPLRIGSIRAFNGCAGRLFGPATLYNDKNSEKRDEGVAKLELLCGNFPIMGTKAG